jgi:6-pyruvoyltetrahydropterin/6-carboxytetrahydropterin synthase
VEIYQEFGFDAAHRFPGTPEGHRYHGVHGHSFTARVVVAGTPDARTGFVADLGELERACAGLRESLDHRFLNEVGGLEVPSLEHIAMWIWAKLEPAFPGLVRVEVRRDSVRHGAVYTGPGRSP